MIGTKKTKFVAVYATATVLLSACTFGRAAQPEVEPLNLPALQTPVTQQTFFTVERGDVMQTMEFDGQAELAVQDDLFFGKSGRVRSINVTNGDQIEEGTLVAEIDTRDLNFDLEEAALSLQLAEEQLANAQELQGYDQQDTELDLAIAELRLSAYQAQEVVDPAELEIRQRQVDQAQLQVERAQNGVSSGGALDLFRYETNVALARLTLERLQASLADSQITAPFSGEVRLYDALKEGKSVNAYETVASVIDPDSYVITANLVRTELEQLYEGMPVAIYLPNSGNLRLEGLIDTLPQPFGRGTGTLPEIELANPEEAANLRAGTAVQIVVELARSEDTLWLPVDVIPGFGDNRFVLVNQGGTIQEVPVQLGLSNSKQVEIVEGGFEGMQVLGQ